MARKRNRGGGHSPLILCPIAAVLIAWSFPAQTSTYCIVHDTALYTQARYNDRAKIVIAEGRKYIQSSSVNIIRLLNGSTNWQERGQTNYGIFEITSPKGGESVVLKIVDGKQFLVRTPGSIHPSELASELESGASPNNSSAAFKQYIDVHTLLGQLSVAPRLIAVLNARSLKQAFGSQWHTIKEVASDFEFTSSWDEKPRFRGGQAVGIVMQRLPPEPEQGPIHPITRATQPHPFMTEWTPQDVERAIRDMIEIRRRVITAGVRASDQQIVVTASARAYLIDLDQARFQAHDPFFDISYEILKLIVQWETITSQTFPASTKFELLVEASLPYEVCTSDDDFKDMLHDWRCEGLLNGRG